MNRERLKADDELPSLTKRQVAELERRMADAMDPTRYGIVSSFLPTFSLFYCPADGVFVMNEIPETALFKRKVEALAVARALERRRRRRTGGLQVIEVKKTKTAVRIVQPVHVHGRSWKPKLKQR